MNSIKTGYCRLCADLKLHSDLIDMERNTEQQQDLVNKLSRFNVTLSFDNLLPKSVCFNCVSSLDRAYDFITTVEQAQEAFSDYVETLDVDKYETDSPEFEAPDSTNDIKSENMESFHAYHGYLEIEMENLKTEDCKTVEVAVSKPIKRICKPKKKLVKEIELTESWKEYFWLCAFCTRQFQSPSELKIHGMHYHNTCNPFRCFDCKIRGLDIDQFVAHICKHRPFLKLSCHICLHKCTTTKDLFSHKKSHSSKFFCRGCKSTFFNQEDLDEHVDKYYRDGKTSKPVIENESLTCFLCQKYSKSRFLLNRHLLIHSDRRRDYVCKICNKKFYKKKELDQHAVVHSDARPFKCEVCQYAFKVKSELKKHATVHFGVNRFTCDDCGKSFRLRKSLEHHTTIHTGERPFICATCDRSFRFRHLLVQHIRMHTGVKPYACDTCPMQFRNWSNYNKHMKEMHGVDKTRRKRTSDGLLAVDPGTGNVIYPEMDKVLEFKNEIMVTDKKGRPKKTKDVPLEPVKHLQEDCESGDE